jgi:MFS family permease
VTGRLRAARAAIFVFFAAHGVLTALWVVHVPLVKARLHLDDRALGFGLFGMSAGAVVAMQAVGPLVRRTGTRAAVRFGAMVLAAALVPTAYVANLPALMIALFVFGMGIGLLDVAMNAQAAEVENGYRRPVMAAFHAGWSLSSVAGAAAGGLAIRAGWPMSRTVGLAAPLVGLLAVLASRWLLPATRPASFAGAPATPAIPGSGSADPCTGPGCADLPAGPGCADPSAGPGGVDPPAGPGCAGPRAGPGCAGPRAGPGCAGPRTNLRAGRGRPVGRPAGHRLPGTVWLLGGLCFGSFLCEGAAADWAGVHLRDNLGVQTGQAAFGYGAFAAAMTVGRLVADRVVAAVGALPVLRFGGALAAIGMLSVVVAPVPAVAVAGWAAAGLGLSGVVPLLFSTAANITGPVAGAAVRTVGGTVARQAASGTPDDGPAADAGDEPASATKGDRLAGGAPVDGPAGGAPVDGPAVLARVTALGYLGTLVGPAVIGLLAHVTGLGPALLLLVLVGVAIAVGARAGLAGSGRSRVGPVGGDSLPGSLPPAHATDSHEVW